MTADDREMKESRMSTNDDVNDNDQSSNKDELLRLLELAKIPIEDLPSVLSPPYTSITKLNLTGCGLSQLPKNFDVAFPNLSILFMSNNEFTELPAMIGRCRQLQMVAFKSNNMTSIHPDALQKQLRWLILTDNCISSIPDSIARCVDLQKLMLSGNALIELPEHAMTSSCHKLELIRLASNQLAAPPTLLLQSLPVLKWMALGDNPFVEPLYDRQEAAMDIPLWHHLDGSSGDILGSGAGGTTRKVYDATRSDHVAIKSFDGPSHHHHPTTTSTTNTRTLRRMTSDGRPEHEALVFCAASAATAHHEPPTVVQVLGQTPDHGLVMEYLHNYRALADPPSMTSCTRDVYTKDHAPLSLPQATHLVSRLLEALVALHAAGICHADFYGHNILIHMKQQSVVDDNTSNEDNTTIHTRLSDFGAAFFYDTQSDWGKCLQICEVRAFGVLVQEVRALVSKQGLGNDADDKEPTPEEPTPDECKLHDDESDVDVIDSTSPKKLDLLEQLANKCLAENDDNARTFDSIGIWWKQQQLKDMARALHKELFY